MSFRELADYDMLCCMIDENNTQQSITPKVVFENVTAAIALAERFLNDTNNVNEFNEFVKTSRLVDNQDVNLWRNNEYEKAKSAISDSGDGLGVFFVKHFMPSPPKDDHTTQTVIDSYYADRRKAAAEKRKSSELEAARIADEECFYLKKVWGGLVQKQTTSNKTSTLQASNDPFDLLPMKRISIRIAVSTFLQLFSYHLKACGARLVELKDSILKTPSFRTGQ